MMDDEIDCLAVSYVAPSDSSSYSTEPVSADTAIHVLMNETAYSLRSFEAYPSTSTETDVTSDRAVGKVKGHMKSLKVR